jgi:hypothetical protein
MSAETGPGLAGKVADAARREAAVYAADAGDERPLGPYAGVMAAYGAVVLGAGAALRRAGVRAPATVGPWDVALVGVATHKLARLLAKDPVTSPLRAPFTKFKGTSGDAELAEEPREHGVRHAVGELVTCPFCLGLWVATGLGIGLAAAPRITRLGAGVFTALTVADFLQYAYAAAEEKAGG